MKTASMVIAVAIGVGAMGCSTSDELKAASMSPAEAEAAIQPAFDDYLFYARMAQHSWLDRDAACKKWHYVQALARATHNAHYSAALSEELRQNFC